jgi:hypothetical protein
MRHFLLNKRKQASLCLMLCGIGLRFNLLGGDVFGRVSDKGSSEGREQPVGFQTAEALGLALEWRAEH